MTLELIHADWPAPANVQAFTTTRAGGVSEGAYRGLNLATHVGDDEQRVRRNRECLQEQAKLPQAPQWLSQCHGDRVVPLPASTTQGFDAAYTTQAGTVCAVLTADCLPLLVCNRHGDEVAAIHAGWRGLHAGVIERCIAGFDSPASALLVWLGPAIGPQAFEVGREVYEAFCQGNAGNENAFMQTGAGHWHCDLYRLARNVLQRLGVEAVYGGDFCTFSDAERFYSYRRDGETGRIASAVWIG